MIIENHRHIVFGIKNFSFKILVFIPQIKEYSLSLCLHCEVPWDMPLLKKTFKTDYSKWQESNVRSKGKITGFLNFEINLCNILYINIGETQ